MAGPSTAAAPSMSAPTRATQSRGHLHVVDAPAAAPKFSALPHDVLFDRRLSRDAVVLYAVLQSHWWQSGECYAGHATLAAEMRVSERMLRRYLDRLIATGHVIESAAGQRRAKVYRPAPIGHGVPIEPSNENLVSDSQEVNRTPVSRQSDTGVRSNRTRSSDSKKKTPEKKTPEEDLQPPAVDGGAGAPPATAAVDQAKILRGLTDGAREILDWHRQCHGRRQPAKLNPESARVLEEAVADLGVERLRESVKYMAGLIPAVPELSKAIRAARTKRTKDEQGMSNSQPTGNRSARPATPRSDDHLRSSSDRVEVFEVFVGD